MPVEFIELQADINRASENKKARDIYEYASMGYLQTKGCGGVDHPPG
jgi:hypothetical protein